MILRAENTKEKREALRGYNIMVDDTDIHTIIAFRFDQEISGTERQIDYARSILTDKIFRAYESARMQLSNKQMTAREYRNGIIALINELSQFTDAEYIIEHFK